MTISFAQMWEQLEKDKARRSPLMTTGEDSRALVVARTGKDMHKDGETPFWDEFISLCGNADGMSQLLGVDTQVIRSWPAKIQEALNKLEKQSAADPASEEEKEVMPTGDTGAFTVNADPASLSILGATQ